MLEGLMEITEILEKSTQNKTWEDYISNKNFIIQELWPSVKELCREVKELKLNHPEVLAQYPHIDWEKYVKFGELASRSLDWLQTWGLLWGKVWNIAKHGAAEIRRGVKA